MARKESASLVAFSRLQEVIESARREGKATIPSERELTRDFGFSRRTVRKAISRAAEQGLLRKEMNTWIIPPIPQQEHLTLGVLVEGRDVPRNRVLARILHHLQMQNSGAPDRDLLIKPFLFPRDNPEPALKRQLDEIRACHAIVFLSLFVYKLANAAIGEHSCLFCVDEGILDPRLHVVSLDNYRVGWMAAKHLLQQGCRKLLGVGRNREYAPFQRRLQGFMERLAREPWDCDAATIALPDSPEIKYLKACENLGRRMAREDYDGVFFHSDEGLETFCIAAGMRDDLPRIIAVFGNGDLNEKNLPVAFFDHAEKAIAQRLLRAAGAAVEGKLEKRLRIHIQPKLDRMSNVNQERRDQCA